MAAVDCSVSTTIEQTRYGRRVKLARRNSICRTTLSCVALFYSALGGQGRKPAAPWNHSRRWAVVSKLEALQAAWGLLAKLPGTDFRQRCRRKRVFNVLEGSNVRFYFLLTQVSAVGLITLPSFFYPYGISRSPRRASCGAGREREGGRGARTTEHRRRQLKHLHQTTARTPL